MKLSKGMLGLGLATFGMLALSPVTFADTIDPETYAATLAEGESVTIRKTVVIEESTSSAVLDVMFVFDVSGSMGGAITAAQNNAASILGSLAGFGDLATGTGWFSDPETAGVHVDLNTTNTADSSGISDMFDSGTSTVAGTFVGFGGDFPERGYAAITDAANNASWRPGSKRVIIAFGDASFKAPGSAASTAAALAAADVDLIGVSFDGSFAAEINAIGGTVYTSSTSGSAVASDILDGITDSFATYSAVTVSDLGDGAPGVAVSVACVTAAAGGACSGADAIGMYTREESRTFEYDVTFTGLAEGVHAFDTRALVDGASVATEADTITVTGSGTVPEPTSLALLGIGLMGFVGARRARG